MCFVQNLCLLVDNSLSMHQWFSRESLEMSHHTQFSIYAIFGFCHIHLKSIYLAQPTLKYLRSICNFRTNGENGWDFLFFKWMLCSLNAIEYANWTKYGVWCRFIIILWYLCSHICMSACSIFQSHYFDAFSRNKTHTSFRIVSKCSDIAMQE